MTIEESYTSKASFVDGDDIPVFDQTNDVQIFSVRGITHGM
ncbi:hypothetical protein P4489_16035 [Heyndrickxia sporothermodurans]|nr:hypothetical protein [Heyndrickxia sporothermodurans]